MQDGNTVTEVWLSSEDSESDLDVEDTGHAIQETDTQFPFLFIFILLWQATYNV